VDDIRFTIPLYTIRSAAAHLDMNVHTLRRWSYTDGIIRVLEPEVQGAPRLPFVALVEAQLCQQWRLNGLSLKNIVAGMKAIKLELGDRMYQDGVLATDGKDIFMRVAEPSIGSEWLRAKDFQTTIPTIIDLGLKLITWDEHGYPLSIALTAYGDADVVADYRYAFGQPVVRSTRVRVEDIIQYFKAGESVESICSELNLEPHIVEAIIRPHVIIAA